MVMESFKTGSDAAVSIFPPTLVAQHFNSAMKGLAHTHYIQTHIHTYTCLPNTQAHKYKQTHAYTQEKFLKVYLHHIILRERERGGGGGGGEVCRLVLSIALRQTRSFSCISSVV